MSTETFVPSLACYVYRFHKKSHIMFTRFGCWIALQPPCPHCPFFSAWEKHEQTLLILFGLFFGQLLPAGLALLKASGTNHNFSEHKWRSQPRLSTVSVCFCVPTPFFSHFFHIFTALFSWSLGSIFPKNSITFAGSGGPVMSMKCCMATAPHEKQHFGSEATFNCGVRSVTQMNTQELNFVGARLIHVDTSVRWKVGAPEKHRSIMTTNRQSHQVTGITNLHILTTLGNPREPSRNIPKIGS